MPKSSLVQPLRPSHSHVVLLTLPCRSEKVEIEDDYFGFAQYDSAARLVGRHNEVHIWTKQKPS